MRDNSYQRNSTPAVKVLAAAVVLLILVLAAFGAGVGIGVGQARHTVAAAGAAPSASESIEPAAAPVEQEPAAAAPAATETPAAAPTTAEQAALPALATPVATKAPTVVGATPAVTAVPTVVQPTPTPQDKSKLPDEAPIDPALLNEAWKLLKDQYYGNLPTGEDVTYAAIRGIIQALGDKHTALLNPQQAQEMNSQLEGQFEGIGAAVEAANGGGVEIVHPYPDQPAQRAGLQQGDVIIKVDGKDVTTVDLNDAVSMIRGPQGTKVTLTVKREDQAAFDVTVTRARIEIPVISTKTVGSGKVEYIALGEFSAVAAQRTQDALQAAVNKKPQGIILDLRNDPGGLLEAAVQIGSFFVPKGNILIERYSDGQVQEHPRDGKYLLGNIPLVVLVNGGSASASEIVAGAIQDAGTGKLVGTQTYGKGSVQLSNRLSDGSQLKVTIARWYTPNNRGIDGTGLAPDIASPDPTAEQINAKQDPQLDRAVEYLLTGK